MDPQRSREGGSWPLSPPSPSSLPAESASGPAPLHRSQSLPQAASAALGGPPDPGTLSSSALSEREAFRLDKFKQLLAGPNTDLGEWFRGRRFPEEPSVRGTCCSCFPVTPLVARSGHVLPCDSITDFLFFSLNPGALPGLRGPLVSSAC